MHAVNIRAFSIVVCMLALGGCPTLDSQGAFEPGIYVGDLTVTETIQATGDYASVLGTDPVEYSSVLESTPFTINNDGLPDTEDDVADFGAIRITSTFQNLTSTAGGVTVTWTVVVEYLDSTTDEAWLTLPGQSVETYKAGADGTILYFMEAAASVSDDLGTLLWTCTMRATLTR